MSKININIPGTIPNSSNFQLLVSSGIPSLDALIGKGLPVGSVTLIEEDIQGMYARIMLKYFLAEGVVNEHEIFVATQEVDPNEIMTRLPALVKNQTANQGSTETDEMKIAFRYTKLPTNDPQAKQEFGHYFDLALTMSDEIISKINVECWPNDDSGKITSDYFENPLYEDLLRSIKSKLTEGQFFLSDKPAKRNLLRIAINSLGSPMWMSENYEDSKQDLKKFLLCLKALIRATSAAAVITIPSHLYDQFDMKKCVNIVDVSIRLKALAGTELENNKYLSEYTGYFYIDKVSATNTFANKYPGTLEYMFKLRRRKFVIELLHLPPDLEISEDKKSTASMGCASNTKHLLEF